ncbi:flavin reductase family protein [Streptomyces sp. TLI_171]|uniref:flavin reductase family protein n=1 Tax=Streptomyces sp. TLI_171 TaxID=1938859 RepID=UPI000C1995E2|nr:flavin reductase family protein [Streptomyces sp. TLI_171]RKE17493.1 flavin reductase (DIM6/NTAB) family NADH-FMN oxidoreductase RutF [Streptomyces sp. TLI_171]
MSSAAAFLDLLDPPVYVVTAEAGDDRAGCLVGFGSQCSIRPERFAVWLSTANRTHRVASRASALGVHLLPPDDAGRALAALFGANTGDEVDKFGRAAWRAGPAGVPVLAAAAAWFAGRIVGRTEGGDHTAFLLDPIGGGVADLAPPSTLRLRDVADLDPGHPA